MNNDFISTIHPILLKYSFTPSTPLIDLTGVYQKRISLDNFKELISYEEKVMHSGSRFSYTYKCSFISIDEKIDLFRKIIHETFFPNIKYHEFEIETYKGIRIELDEKLNFIYVNTFLLYTVPNHYTKLYHLHSFSDCPAFETPNTKRWFKYGFIHGCNDGQLPSYEYRDSNSCEILYHKYDVLHNIHMNSDYYMGHRCASNVYNNRFQDFIKIDDFTKQEYLCCPKLSTCNIPLYIYFSELFADIIELIIVTRVSISKEIIAYIIHFLYPDCRMGLLLWFVSRIQNSFNNVKLHSDCSTYRKTQTSISACDSFKPYRKRHDTDFFYNKKIKFWHCPY
jgi:hypothetical protein